jgi:thioredoxin reductase
MFDVAIAGAGPAGLSAALLLGRCRRSVLLCDKGEPRNAVSHGLHGFLSRDGLLPAELRRIAFDQLAPYQTVEVCSIRIEEARREGDRFTATLANGTRIETRRLLLTMGRRDDLPPIPGLPELWGHSIFHCRYCDGWEVRDRPLAVVTGPNADRAPDAQLAIQLTRLSDDVVWCTNGPYEPDEVTRRRMHRHGVRVRQEPVAALEGRGGQLERIVFAEGEPLPRHAAFLDPPKLPHSDLAVQLGCSILDDGCVEVSERRQTTVPGVFAAGDMSRRPARPLTSAQIVMAAADGATAAVAMDLELFLEEAPDFC